MSSNEYFLAWMVYGLSCFFVTIFWFWMTSLFSSMVVKLFLRLPVMALLLTPMPHALDQSLYVPAIAAVAFDFIGKDSLRLSEDIMTLLTGVLASLVLALVLSLLGMLLSRLMREKTDNARQRG